VNNTIVLLNAKVAEDPDVQTHVPLDLLHLSITI